MANRYWVGGTGTWTTSSTTNWSAAAGLSFTASTTGTNALTTVGSPALVVGMTVYNAAGTSLGTITGGSGNAWTLSTTPAAQASQTMTAQTIGASVPTTADNVFFTAGSGTGTITLTGALNCLSFDTTGSAALTFSGTPTLNCAGSFTIVTNTTWSPSATITFSSTTTGRTITTNGRSMINTNITFNGVGGGWTLAGALSHGAGSLTLTAGTFSSGGFALACGSVNISGSTTRTFNITNSTVTVTSAWTATTTTNLTFTSTGSSLSFSSGGATFALGGLTYNSVIYTSTAVALSTITGANTFATLNISNRSGASLGVAFYAFGANQTVTGTFSLGSSGDARGRTMLSSDIAGTTRTITAASVSLGDVDFRNITGAGAASWTGTRLGNATGNSGITFATPKNIYWNLAGTQNWNANGWAATSGGTPASTNYPLPQDTAFIEGVGTAITLNAVLNLPNIDLLTASSAVVLQMSTSCAIYGFLKLGTANPTGSAGSPLTFANQDSDKTITSNGRTISSTIIIDTVDTIVSLTDALSVINPITVTSGTYSTANFAHTSQAILSSGTTTRAINLGSSAISLTGIGTVLSTAVSGLTWNPGTSTITISDNSNNTKTIANSVPLNNLVLAGTGNVAFTTNGFIMNSFTSSRAPGFYSTLTFLAAASYTIGTWGITGSVGNFASINSSTAGTQATINITNKTSGIDYLSIQNISNLNITPVTFWVGANSTNSGNNSGIAFADGTTTEAYILTTVGTGTFTTPVNWNSSNNQIHLIGGGGGGSGSGTATGNFRVGGAGGGGGAYTKLSNVPLIPTAGYITSIGAGGTAGAAITATNTTATAGTGGNTSIIYSGTTYTANGGVGGSISTIAPSSTGGNGGAAQTVSGLITAAYTGGTGGVGGTAVSNQNGGGGGGGAAGVNGNGGNGGTGVFGDNSGGGGGGNGGGSAGGNASSGLSGVGGNNSLGSGGGASVTNAAGNAGVRGGGGSGGEGTNIGGRGGAGADVLGGFGSGGGAGGSGNVNNTATAGLYGAGGAGAGNGNSNSFTGMAGAQGVIIIVYSTGGGSISLSNFFLLF